MSGRLLASEQRFLVGNRLAEFGFGAGQVLELHRQRALDFQHLECQRIALAIRRWRVPVADRFKAAGRHQAFARGLEIGLFHQLPYAQSRSRNDGFGFVVPVARDLHFGKRHGARIHRRGGCRFGFRCRRGSGRGGLLTRGRRRLPERGKGQSEGGCDCNPCHGFFDCTNRRAC